MKTSRFLAGTRGVAAAVFKRLVFVGLALIALQLFGLQYTVNTTEDRQAQEARDRLQKALEANQREHLKTQRYIRCIVLLPVGERTEENFAKCGETGKVEPLINSGATRDNATESTAPSTARTVTVTTSSPPDPSAAPTTEPAPQKEQPEPAEPFLDASLLLPVTGTELKVAL